MAKKDKKDVFSHPVFLGALILLISAALMYWINNMVGGEVKPPKKTVQNITVITPPPPKEEIEPPEVEEEPEIEEPEIEEPQMEEMPDNLSEDDGGSDADAAAGGILPPGKKGGGVTGSKEQRYAQFVVREEIKIALIEAGVLDKKYDIKLNVWVNDEGKLVKFKLLQSTGNRKTDKKIKKVLASFGSFSKPRVGEKNLIQLALNAK